jgi:fumarate hydratase class II
MLEQSFSRIKLCLKSFCELPLGGTAVGTGINTPKDFDHKIVKIISDFTNFSFKSIDNKFRGLASKDNVVSMHGEIKTLATSLYKIANDIRFLSSGPICGLGELIIPANEPGSSIMPGKINPTQCESLMMIASQVLGNDVTISFSAMQGNFELNTFMPLIAFNLLQSINLLSQSINNFTDRCVVGIKPNLKRINQNLEHSLMNVTALTPKIGYEKAAQIAKHAYQQQISLKEAAIALGYVTAEEFDQLVVFKKMI